MTPMAWRSTSGEYCAVLEALAALRPILVRGARSRRRFNKLCRRTFEAYDRHPWNSWRGYS